MAKDWQHKVEAAFPFLAERGFRRTAEATSFWETSCTWSAGSVAIKVAESTEFQRVDVHLVRLVDGEVPPYPIWVTDEPQNWALMDNVLQARSSEAQAQIPAGGLSRRSVAEQLAFWAGAIQDAAPDFLAGSPACIDEAADIVRAKLADTPQRLLISLPDGASSEDERVAVADARRGLPPNVEVVVRRYRRPD